MRILFFLPAHYSCKSCGHAVNCLQKAERKAAEIKPPIITAETSTIIHVLLYILPMILLYICLDHAVILEGMQFSVLLSSLTSSDCRFHMSSGP